MDKTTAVSILVYNQLERTGYNVEYWDRFDIEDLEACFTISFRKYKGQYIFNKKNVNTINNLVDFCAQKVSTYNDKEDIKALMKLIDKMIRFYDNFQDKEYYDKLLKTQERLK